jgi:Family of unknown function (DUF6188)
MYGLPSDPAVDVLKGQTLIQICFGENDLFLNFSGNLSFGIYSSIGLGVNADRVIKSSDFVKLSQELLRLLSVLVSDVTWAKDGRISITFETGYVVELYDDSEQFESYTIKRPDGVVIV